MAHRPLRATALALIALGGLAAAQSPQPPAATAPATPSQPAAAPAPPACASAEHRQFDFWVGRWDVYRTGTNRLAGRNLIERLYADCAIRESWTPAAGSGGSSLNSWLPGERKWRQTWVDGGNSYAVFEGNFANGEMVLTGIWAGPTGPANTPIVRMHYTPLDGGGLRQWGEQSTDNGVTWAPSFDFTYRPAAGP